MTLEEYKSLKVGDEIIYTVSRGTKSRGTVTGFDRGSVIIGFENKDWQTDWRFLRGYINNAQLVEDEADKLFKKIRQEVENEV